MVECKKPSGVMMLSVNPVIFHVRLAWGGVDSHSWVKERLCATLSLVNFVCMPKVFGKGLVSRESETKHLSAAVPLAISHLTMPTRAKQYSPEVLA